MTQFDLATSRFLVRRQTTLRELRWRTFVVGPG